MKDEDIDKLIDDVDIQLETEPVENTPKDDDSGDEVSRQGVKYNEVEEIPKEKPKKNSIEKPKRVRSEAQIKAWEKARETRKNKIAQRKAEKDEKDAIKEAKKAKKKKKKPPTPSSSEYEESSSEEEEIVYKKKPKPKPKPKKKVKVVYVESSSDDEEVVVKKKTKSPPKPQVEEKEEDPYAHLDWRTRARLRGF